MLLSSAEHRAQRIFQQFGRLLIRERDDHSIIVNLRLERIAVLGKLLGSGAGIVIVRRILQEVFETAGNGFGLVLVLLSLVFRASTRGGRTSAAGASDGIYAEGEQCNCRAERIFWRC